MAGQEATPDPVVTMAGWIENNCSVASNAGHNIQEVQERKKNEDG
jgi:hypothetical protein